MIDFGELWRREASARRAPDDAATWDERARDAVSKYGPSAYSEEFLRLVGLRPGESVFDMGCGAGALAIPCAMRGHRVLAADFSPAMLAQCAAGLPAEAPGTLETRLLAWDDDWSAAGVGRASFDVALASRSIATPDMRSALGKLSSVARRKACITVTAGGTPRVSVPFLEALGLTCAGHQDAAFAFAIALQLGYRPEVRFIESERIDWFASREEAHAAYLKMLDLADGEPGGRARGALEDEARAWVDLHLEEAGPMAVPAEGAGLPPAVRASGCDRVFHIDVPRVFSWAFISWNV